MLNEQPNRPPTVAPVRVTQAIMAKGNGGQSQILEGHVSDPNSKKVRPEHGYWLIPPEIWNPLNEEFGFDFDPCPNPRPDGFDGLTVPWGKTNWVNPPFWAGVTAWVRKALAEQEKGNTSVLILPLDNWVNLLVRSINPPGKNADIRPVGNHDWIHTQTGKRQKAPRPSILFVLRGKLA